MFQMLRGLLAVVVFTLCSAAPLRDSVHLKLNYKAGDVLRLRMTQEQSFETELMPAMETQTAFALKQVVKEVDEQGVATVSVSYEGIRQESEGPMAMSYDSRRKGDEAQKNAPMLAQLFDPMLAIELSMEVEPSGRIRAIQGVEELVETVTGALGDSSAQLKTLFESLFGEDSLRRLWEVAVFPADPIEPGYAWKRSLEVELPMMGEMKVVFDQTFQGIETARERRCARIGLEGTVSLEIDESLPVQVTLESPEVTGWLLIALDDGAPMETRQDIEMEMRIGPKDASEAMPAMEMKMSISQHMQRLAADAPMFED